MPMTLTSIMIWFLAIIPIVTLLCVLYGTLIYPQYFSPYKDMVALPKAHWLWGTFAEYAQGKFDHAEYMEKHHPGHAFTRFHGPLGSDYIMAQSVEAHIQILQVHAYKFVKPWFVSRRLKGVIGNGLFFSELEDHRAQRRIMTPAFTYGHVRSFVPIFMEKIKIACTIFDEYTKDGPAVFTQNPIFARLTLDAMGEATFGLNMHALDDENNELVAAYRAVSTMADDSMLVTVSGFIPGFKYLPLRRNRAIKRAQSIFREACRTVLLRKTGMLSDKQVEGKDRDIVSILLRDSDYNWTIDEIENQIKTLLLAGHETTSSAVTWTLWALVQHPDIQEKLRQEVRTSFPGGIDDITSAEAIESVEYLTKVVRESLRVYAPAPFTVREAIEDVTIEGTFIKKGTTVQISIAALNKSTILWGPDAEEFNPDRWSSGSVNNVFGYSTFLHGARACLGRKFAELELKCIVAAFVAKYKFEKADPDQTVAMDFILTAKPLGGLPLKVSKLEGW
ncbi:cytochrome P450 [Lipomyces kononenkoae]|uniref:Cytochrome P450 n=1 Tax=Lipomyces kononenkoae TaxID=34357 RepID=A0ACC3SW85_LIPKO